MNSAILTSEQYVADMILSINENRTYKNPPPTDEKARRKQDDEIFHRSRLVYVDSRLCTRKTNVSQQ
jgi:hypothetical protein